MNGERRPQAKLGLRHVQQSSDERKGQQGDRVENENCAQRDRNLFFAGIGNGRDGGDGAAAADGGACTDQERSSATHFEKLAQSPSQRQGKGDADCRVDKSGAADADHLMEIHAEAKADDGGLQ